MLHADDVVALARWLSEWADWEDAELAAVLSSGFELTDHQLTNIQAAKDQVHVRREAAELLLEAYELGRDPG